jgi:hypothetical protein
LPTSIALLCRLVLASMALLATASPCPPRWRDLAWSALCSPGVNERRRVVMHPPVVATTTIPCPRCGAPIIWAKRERGKALPVAGWQCFCNLTNREWFALAIEADIALAKLGRTGDSDQRDAREA